MSEQMDASTSAATDSSAAPDPDPAPAAALAAANAVCRMIFATKLISFQHCVARSYAPFNCNNSLRDMMCDRIG